MVHNCIVTVMAWILEPNRGALGKCALRACAVLTLVGSYRGSLCILVNKYKGLQLRADESDAPILTCPPSQDQQAFSPDFRDSGAKRR